MRSGRGKVIVLIVVATFVVAQLVPVAKLNPAVESDIPTSPEIKELLRRACYDCHSNETVWPWYSEIAPVSWLVAHDVDEGREYLNFSTWAAYDDPKKLHELLEETEEEIEEGEMPPTMYVIMHPEAKLTEQDKTLLRDWAAQTAEAISRYSQ